MKRKGKWKISDSTTVYKNPWVTIIEEKGTQPDGKDGLHVLILYKAGIAVLPMDDDDNVYLNKEYRFAIEEECIEIVSGGIDGKETPLEAAKKELKEELGIIAKEWIDLGVYHPLTESILAPSSSYIARKLRFVDQNTEGTEDIRRIKVPLKNAVRMVLDGKIKFATAGLLILIAWEKYATKKS